MSRHRRIFLWILALALAAMCLAEWRARLAYREPRLGIAFERGPRHRVIIVNPPQGAGDSARVTTNRWGMRGDEPPVDWSGWETWIAVGSSTTLCANLDDSAAWPARVQARLRRARPRVWVGNAGEDGLTTASLVLMVDKVVRKVQPTGMLILPGGPDLRSGYSHSAGESPNPYDEAFRKRLARWGEAPTWRERLGLCWAWRNFRRPAQRPFLPDRASHVAWFPPQLAQPEEALPSGSDSSALIRYRSQLQTLGSLARDLRVRALFLTQPIVYRNDSIWRKREARPILFAGQEYCISAAAERKLRDAYNRVLLQVCAADHLECLDLDDSLPRDTGFYYDAAHFNNRGSDAAAEYIAKHLANTPD